MALGNNNFAQYLTTHKGKLYLSSDKEHSNPNDYVEGYVSHLAIVEKELTTKKDNKKFKIKQLVISIRDKQDTYKVSISVKLNDYAKIVGQLVNVDLAKKLKINAAATTLTSGETGTSLYITQDGGVKSAFSKESGTIELPKWKEILVDGEKKFDRTEYLAKIEEIVNEKLIPNVNSPEEAPAEEEVSEEGNEVESTDEEYDSDSQELPF